MKDSQIFECSIFELPKIHNDAGSITALENNMTVPFKIQRVYYLYDVPGGEQRGGHAHKELQQFIMAVNGSLDVLVDDGRNKKIFNLNRPYIGLHIVPGIWRELINFSSGANCLVLASHLYDEDDYLRDYLEFCKIKKNDSSHCGSI